MKKTTLSLFLLLSCFCLNAQVSINTDNSNPDPSAMLDVKSIDKGILIPRMTAAERDAIAAPANGLLVYVTTDSAFYFYEGSTWAKIGRAGWRLNGNAGTTDNTDFIGTTDTVPLNFKVNNARVLRLEFDGDSLNNGPNIIAGSPYNSVGAGIIGATISGGGGNEEGSGFSNGISGNGHYGTIGGGNINAVSGKYATIPGGYFNSARANFSFAAGTGSYIDVAHTGATLFSDFDDGFTFNSLAANEFAVRARGGVRFVTATNSSGNPTQTVRIDDSGTVTASAFVGDGSGLTNVPPGNGWSLTGNAGTVDGTNFIGTTDSMPLDFRINNVRALRLEYSQNGPPNIISGAVQNEVSPGIYGATIVGGGGAGFALNTVSANFGSTLGGKTLTASGEYATVLGGESNRATGFRALVAGGLQNEAGGSGAVVLGGSQNTASGSRATVIGGSGNYAISDNSFVVGERGLIKSEHSGTFLFAAPNPYYFNSEAANEFAIRATGGVRFVTAVGSFGTPTQTVRIDNTGTVTAAAFVGDGTGLTGIPDDQTLSLSGATLSIEAGNSVNLAGINTDNQMLSLSGTTLSIENGNSVNLPSLGSDNLGNHTATQNINLNGHYLSGNGGNKGIFISSGGNVGIGTTTPAFGFTVVGPLFGGSLNVVDWDTSNGTQVVTELRGNNAGSQVRFSNNGNGLFTDIGQNAAGDFTVEVNDAQYLVVTNAGNVGIGTTTPTANLDVNGSVRFQGGSPGEGKVLTSDADGNASWQNLPGPKYTKTTGATTYSNDDSWQSVTNSVSIPWTNGDAVKIEGMATLRLTAGTGVDQFEMRVRLDYELCGAVYSNTFQYTPGESIQDHDNVQVMPYLDIITLDDCSSGPLSFTLEVRNTGDDAWEAQDRVLIITKL
ncbi:MAG: hypothetical protein H6574_08590 [Lewinellaceae bacterium]|nr:hypothetical protein [Lewinellaceae bacterium]